MTSSSAPTRIGRSASDKADVFVCGALCLARGPLPPQSAMPPPFPKGGPFYSLPAASYKKGQAAALTVAFIASKARGLRSVYIRIKCSLRAAPFPGYPQPTVFSAKVLSTTRSKSTRWSSSPAVSMTVSSRSNASCFMTGVSFQASISKWR